MIEDIQDNPVVLERIEEIYQYLVDQTENHSVIMNGKKNDLLGKLLEMFEYIRDNDTENPVPDWFE